MNIRTAAKILTAVDRWPRHLIHRPQSVREALSIMSRHPKLVERIVCRTERVHFLGSDYQITPVLVHQRFGDGCGWGTVQPLNTRSDYYIVMGDSSWERNDAIWDVLESEILPAIEDQYGRYDFECVLCGCTGWGEGHDNCECYRERGWPALDDDCGCGWCFPCYRAVTAEQYRIDTWHRKTRT
ncbi:MAG: hypothetical protein WCY09_10105 [Candidatus Omnitrophota bacterium]